MTIHTKSTILKTSKQLFAVNGYEGFSMRTLANNSGVGLSSIYHFFNDKDEILKEIFDTTGKELGIARAKLPRAYSANMMLRDRISFQFNNIENVVFVLKYYLHFRPEFLKLDSGFLPTNAYTHIETVLSFGIENKEFNIQRSEIGEEAKIIAHAINGFLLEYFPNPPIKDELENITNSIHKFLLRSLTNREEVMK